jgi:hypothetical protein
MNHKIIYQYHITRYAKFHYLLHQFINAQYHTDELSEEYKYLDDQSLFMQGMTPHKRDETLLKNEC